MIKVGLIYNGKNALINKLDKYDLTVLVENENEIKELIKYNIHIKMIKYDDSLYDILIKENDDNFGTLSAIKKVAIGNFKEHQGKITYLEKYDEELIFNNLDGRNYKFSIIVPNYNNAEWIGRTIGSVKKQTYQNWEMYIIDDMSTDNSIEEIKKFNDERITLIQNKIKLYNGGSRNIGILRAKETNYDGYLLFIDSDDWLADNYVLENLNRFIEDEDLITLDYQYYMDGKEQGRGRHNYKNKDDLFMTNGAMCAVWCKCFKTKIAPLFEFNTLMEDRNYHYRLVNKIRSYANYGRVTHTWNKMNIRSVTSNKHQKYDSDLQSKIEWNNCAYRHIAGMLDLLNELTNPQYVSFIKMKIDACKSKVNNGVYEQY